MAVDFFPHVNSKVHLDQLGVPPPAHFSAAPHDEIRLLVKRATDIVLASAALAQATFPEATLTLTRSLNSATGLAVPLEPLEKASAANMADIAEEMVSSTEVQELVATLEQQYDALQADRPDRVPSAEEIAAEFERFLADREKDD